MLMPVAVVTRATVISDITGLQTALDAKQALSYQIPRCQAIRSSTFQSIAASTMTAMIFDNADTYDTDNMHDPATNPSRITATTGGVYLLTTTIVWATNGTGVRGIGFRLNGSGAESFDIAAAFATTTQQVQSQALIVPLAATEYAEVIVWQNTAGALNAGSNDTLASVMTKFTAARIGSL